jgi:hypothetical protein
MLMHGGSAISSDSGVATIEIAGTGHWLCCPRIFPRAIRSSCWLTPLCLRRK